MEYQGYELEAAEGTFELLVREALHPGVKLFEVVNYDVTTRLIGGTTATVTLRDPGQRPHGDGHGPRPHERARSVLAPVPVDGLSQASRTSGSTDYKVRVLDSKKGTAAKVRVLVEWSDHRRSWATVGVSDNVIEASWRALVDAIRLELMRLTEQDENVDKVVEDYCWGV